MIVQDRFNMQLAWVDASGDVGAKGTKGIKALRTSPLGIAGIAIEDFNRGDVINAGVSKNSRSSFSLANALAAPPNHNADFAFVHYFAGVGLGHANGLIGSQKRGIRF